MQEVPMRPFASSIGEAMLSQICDELPNLARHIQISIKKTTSKQRESQNAATAPNPCHPWLPINDLTL